MKVLLRRGMMLADRPKPGRTQISCLEAASIGCFTVSGLRL